MVIEKADGIEAERLCCAGGTGSIEARDVTDSFGCEKTLDKYISRCDT